MKKGSLRLTWGSTQHTSVESWIQAQPQRSQLGLDMHLPWVLSLRQKSNSAMKPRNNIPWKGACFGGAMTVCGIPLTVYWNPGLVPQFLRTHPCNYKAYQWDSDSLSRNLNKLVPSNSHYSFSWRKAYMFYGWGKECILPVLTCSNLSVNL